MNLNLVEILLKDAPRGTKLWSPIYGECEFIEVSDNFHIVCNNYTGRWVFLPDGKFAPNGECMLFPSKENRDWSTFKVSEGHKSFEPFQRVLCAFDHGYEIWAADVYSHYDESTGKHFLVSGYVANDNELIPFEGNEDKLGKSVK